MSDTAKPRMLDLLNLEQIDRDLFRGINEPTSTHRTHLYGGQIAAQALKAVGITAPEGRFPHSLHGYFLRRGDPKQPVIFKVERDRDGRSFSARRVSAVQDGAVIFDMTASFHVREPGGEYAVPIADGVPAPQDCPPDITNEAFPLLEVRMVPPTTIDDTGSERSSTSWLRVREELGDDPLTHSCALAYLSDLGSGFMSLDLPGLPRGGPSLDHAMWFRAPIRADQWVLHHMWPLMAGGARGLYAGAIHQQDGTLGSMITQECLLRPLA
jgi:acyl-CoA thioesterase II